MGSPFQIDAFQPNAFQSTSHYEYASMLVRLLPPGRLWRLIPGASLLYATLQSIAVELGRVHDRADDLLRESVPSTAVELLPEYEAERDLTAAPTIDERRANVIARETLRQRVRPADWQAALAPLLGQAAADVVIIERTRAQVIAMGDDREIYRWFIYRDPALPGTAFIASAQAFVTKREHSHTLGAVIESVAMVCDDPHSLCDRDLLGA